MKRSVANATAMTGKRLLVVGWDGPAPLAVAPEALRGAMRELRVHPSDIGVGDLVGLVPQATEIDQRRDRRLARLAASLARTASVHSAATHIAEHAAWDMLCVRYNLLADAAPDIALAPRQITVALPSPAAPADGDPARYLATLGYSDRAGAAEARAIELAALQAQRNLADALLARGDWQSAAAAYEAVLQRAPDDYAAS